MKTALWVAAAVAAAVALPMSAALAQVASPKIVISNTSPQAEIRLLPGSAVEFEASGDLRVQCHKTGVNCTTANIGGGGVGNPPTGVSLNATPLEVIQNSQVNLSWSSSGAAACYGSGLTRNGTPVSLGGWTGQLLATSRSSGSPLPLSLSQLGEHVFQMYCFSASGVSPVVSSQTVSVIENPDPGPGPGEAYCGEYYDGTTRPVPTHPSFTGYSLQAMEFEFSTLFGVTPGAPSSIKRGVPGNYVSNAASQYLLIPFVLNEDTDLDLSTIVMNWIEGGAYGILGRPVAITVSPCPGDMRRRQNSSPDIYERGVCRVTNPSMLGGPMIITARSGASGCPAPKGKQMYLNIIAYNIDGTSLPAQSTCGSDPTCGVALQVD